MVKDDIEKFAVPYFFILSVVWHYALLDPVTCVWMGREGGTTEGCKMLPPKNLSLFTGHRKTK